VVAEPGVEVPATAMAAWRMAPAGSAIVLGAPGTRGFAEHFVDRDLREDQTTVYVCRGMTCFAPATELAELRTALWSRA
ncbi:MAG: thioredoxin domain-containing protein, partial [Micropruina sp.]